MRIQTARLRITSGEHSRFEEVPIVTEQGVDWDKLISLEHQPNSGVRFHEIAEYLKQEGLLTSPKQGSYFFVTQYDSVHTIEGYHFSRKDDARKYQAAHYESQKHFRVPDRLKLARMVDGLEDVVNPATPKAEV